MSSDKDVLHIYTRVSKDDDGTSHSLDDQRDLGVKKSVDLKMDHQVWNEGVVSAGSDTLDNRPVLRELLENISNGEVKHIYVWERSRVIRSEEIKYLFNRECKRKNILVYDRSGKPVDLNDPTDQLLTGIVDQISIYERALIKERTQRGVKRSFELGKIGGATPPYGFTRSNDGFLIVDEFEKEHYLSMVEWVESGLSISEVVKRLNDREVPTKIQRYRQWDEIKWKHRTTKELKSKKIENIYWKTTTVYKILQNPVAVGLRRFRNELIQLPNGLKLIDKARWDHLQNKISRQKEMSKGRKGGRMKNRYLLKGLLRCGHCGSNLMGRMSGSHVYYCSRKRPEMRDSPNDLPCELRSLNIEFFEEFIWGLLCKTLSDSHLRRDEIKKMILNQKHDLNESEIKTRQSRLTSIGRELEDLKNQQTRLVRSYTRGILEEELYETEIVEIQAQIRNRQDDRDKVRNQLNISENPRKWFDWLDQFDKEISNLSELTDDDPKKVEILRKYVDQITVTSDQNKIHHIEVRLTYSIVNDKLIYNDPTDKKKGYRIEEGSDRVQTTTTIPRKKRTSQKYTTQASITGAIECVQ